MSFPNMLTASNSSSMFKSAMEVSTFCTLGLALPKCYEFNQT